MATLATVLGSFDVHVNGKWKRRHFGWNTNRWSAEQGYPYELESEHRTANAGVAFSKTRAYVCVDESETGKCVEEVWPIKNLKFVEGHVNQVPVTRNRNPDSVHIDISSHNTSGRGNRARNPAMKHDANFWREECNYCSRVADKKGRVKEMNNSTATFKTYLKMQRDQAEREGFYDAATYLQEILDDMPGPNPTPRIKRNKLKTQPSQLTGEAPSARLVKRRKKTAAQPMPGVWANPLTRVKVNDPPSRGGFEMDDRLKARRKLTTKAPAGFYANPAPKRTYTVYFQTDAMKANTWTKLAMFHSAEKAKQYAHAYAKTQPSHYVRVESHG